jgi:hypothetical protein
MKAILSIPSIRLISITPGARSDISDNFTAAIAMRRRPVNSPALMSS